MDDEQNDYDRLAEELSSCLAVFLKNTYMPVSELDNTVSMKKNGFIEGVVSISRLIGYIEGLAKSHREIQGE